jgi:hypothetical protein
MSRSEWKRKWPTLTWDWQIKCKISSDLKGRYSYRIVFGEHSCFVSFQRCLTLVVQNHKRIFLSRRHANFTLIQQSHKAIANQRTIHHASIHAEQVKLYMSVFFDPKKRLGSL